MNAPVQVSLSFPFQGITRNDTRQFCTQICRVTWTIVRLPAKINKPVAPDVISVFRTREIAQAVSSRAYLSFVTFLYMNTGTNYHLMAFTSKKAHAGNVCDFTQHDECFDIVLHYQSLFQFLASFVFQTEAFHYILVTSIRESYETKTNI